MQCPHLVTAALSNSSCLLTALSLSLCTDDNLRLRENVQARLDEKTTEFDNLLKQKTQLDRDYQMLSHKVKESEKKAFERIVA